MRLVRFLQKIEKASIFILDGLKGNTLIFYILIVLILILSEKRKIFLEIGDKSIVKDL